MSRPAGQARRRGSGGAVLALIAITACAAADVPEIYHGQVGGVTLAVPSRIASSVLYDDESDWTPPERPKAERTDRDAIRSIEFYVDLDHSDEVIDDETARGRLLERGGALHLPSVVGHVIGVTADFPAERQPDAVKVRASFDFQPAIRALKPAPSEYGLETRRADWSERIPGRERHGGGIFNVDVDYLSRADDIWIYCNDARQVVAPFGPMPTCQFQVIVPELHGRLLGAMDRGDVPRWRELRAAALRTLDSFRKR